MTQRSGPLASRQAGETPDSNEEDEDSSPITRAAVLANALEIIDRNGVEGLSMRRLGEAVGRDPMVLYRHVPNKAAVLDGVAEMVFEQLSLDTTRPDWAAALRHLAHDFRDLARAHPNVVPLLVTRPLATPLGMRPQGMLRQLEDVLALLTGVGFSGADAVLVYRALFGFLYGHVLTELQVRFGLRADLVHHARDVHARHVRRRDVLEHGGPGAAAQAGVRRVDRGRVHPDAHLPGARLRVGQLHHAQRLRRAEFRYTDSPHASQKLARATVIPGRLTAAATTTR